MKNGDDIIRQSESKCSSKYVNALNFTLIRSTAFISLYLVFALSHFLPILFLSSVAISLAPSLMAPSFC